MYPGIPFEFVCAEALSAILAIIMASVCLLFCMRT